MSQAQFLIPEHSSHRVSVAWASFFSCPCTAKQDWESLTYFVANRLEPCISKSVSVHQVRQTEQRSPYHLGTQTFLQLSLQSIKHLDAELTSQMPYFTWHPVLAPHFLQSPRQLEHNPITIVSIITNSHHFTETYYIPMLNAHNVNMTTTMKIMQFLS